MFATRLRPAVAVGFVTLTVVAGLSVAGGPVAVPATTSAAPAAAVMDNPLYAAWAKWKPGTSVTLRGGFADETCRVADSDAEALPFTLLSVSSEAVRVRMDVPQPEPVVVLPAKVPLGRFRLAGLRRVTVAGRTFTCKMYNGPDGFGNGDDCRWTYWLSDDVPGGIVKFGGTTKCCGQTGYFAGTLPPVGQGERPTTRAAISTRPAISTQPATTRTATTRASGDRRTYYSGWAKFKPGSSATYEVVEPGDGPKKIRREETVTLVAVTSDAVELSAVERVTIDGKTQAAAEADARHIPAVVEECEVLGGGWMRRDGPRDVTVAGKAVHCVLYEGVMPGCCTGREGTVFERDSDDVPGGVVEAGGRDDVTKPAEWVFERLTTYTVK